MQLQLTLERFRLINEQDETDYRVEEVSRLQDEVNAALPAGTLWMPNVSAGVSNA